MRDKNITKPKYRREIIPREQNVVIYNIITSISNNNYYCIFDHRSKEKNNSNQSQLPMMEILKWLLENRIL